MDAEHIDTDNIVQSDDVDERTVYATFEDHEQFLALRDEFLAIDLYTDPVGDAERLETLTHRKITLIVRLSLSAT